MKENIKTKFRLKLVCGGIKFDPKFIVRIDDGFAESSIVGHLHVKL